MEYVINLMDVDANPSEWARQREDEGWHVLSVADHLYTGTRPFPHVWVAISSIATSTSHVKITTSFVNNLLLKKNSNLSLDFDFNFIQLSGLSAIITPFSSFSNLGLLQYDL